jgi:catalase
VNDLGNRLVDAVLRDFPDHVAGTRPNHSWGIGVRGSFDPSPLATTYCTAELFKGRVNTVFVRFSNGTGSPGVPDFEPDLRGMAVKFCLSGDAVVDLIGINMPVIPFRTVDDFFGFTAAGVPRPVRRRSFLRKVEDLLTLRQSPPEPDRPMSGEPGLFYFGVTHPVAASGLLALGAAATAPASYARVAYHTVHAFGLTGPDEVRRWVRFHWDPAAGVRPVGDSEVLSDDYLRTELRQRLSTDRTIEFSLRMQIADVGDDPADPTRPWPLRRPLVDMGRLTLRQVLDDATTEALSFNPARLVEGMAACSDDEILRARGPAYEASCERRGGSGCPLHALNVGRGERP